MKSKSPPKTGDVRPLRSATIDDVAAKVDALAADVRDLDIAQRDHRDLAGRQHIETKALREIAIEHTERFDRVDMHLQSAAIGIAVAKSEASRAADGVLRIEAEVQAIGGEVSDLTAAMIHERADTAGRVERERKAIVAETSNRSAAKSGGVVAIIYVVAEIVRILLTQG